MPSFGIQIKWPNPLEDKWNEIKKLAGNNYSEIIRRQMLQWLERQVAIREGKPVGPIKSMDMREATDEIGRFSTEDCDKQFHRISGVLKSIKQRSDALYRVSLNHRIIGATKSEIKPNLPKTTTMSDDNDEEVVEDEEEVQ